MPTSSDYERLPGSSLWVSSDHLLNVHSRWFAEEYHRFYLRDIQAITLRERQGLGLLLETILAMGLVMLAVSALLVYWLAIPAGLALAVYVINRIRGPRCTFSLRTATGDWPIQSFGRIRPARTAFAVIRARIDALQGILDTDSAFERQAVPQWPVPPPRDLRAGQGWYLALFIIVLVSAALNLTALARPGNAVITTVSTLSGFLVILFGVLAMVRGATREDIRHHSAFVVLLLKIAKGCIEFTQFVWIPFEVSRAPSLAQGISVQRLWDNSSLIYGAFEVLLAVVALAALADPRGQRSW